ncbi:hypothetical protein LENED_003884 [Lentinula edodes]|uniref:Uncharacterized protein n=1 Tax=Lentinula edodes TaxID=5353 RepID=A0A1Q3E4T0_LENED|nr:hypothetical protein LENED_003884 [Lentinula edodes]
MRPRAGPLPSKRGEIGFREDLEKEETVQGEDSSSSLPERHPADRDSPPTSNPAADAPAAIPTTFPGSPASTSDDASTSALKKPKTLLSFLKRKKFGGIQLGTLIVFAIQLFITFGTIGAWTVAGLFLSGKAQSRSNDSTMSAASATIFVHVIFAVAFLKILPFSRRGQPVDDSVAFSPWNRPPLPTYAAALAQSGVGTGDVEDHLIAAPPPPAYGNTRGSTLLLSGFLNANLRAQRPISVRTEISQHHQDRPVSYVSDDEEWETGKQKLAIVNLLVSSEC